jgi:hypothetical protein
LALGVTEGFYVYQIVCLFDSNSTTRWLTNNQMFFREHTLLFCSSIQNKMVNNKCVECKKYQQTPRECSTCKQKVSTCQACWEECDHYLTCLPAGLSSTAHLVAAVYADLFPTEISTITDYGFINCSNEHERIYLFGTYVGLIKYHECPEKELEEYCKKGKIAELIDKYFLQEPPRFTGGKYYPWFDKNRHLVKNEYGRKNKKSSKKVKNRGSKGPKAITIEELSKKVNGASVKELKDTTPVSVRHSFTEGATTVDYGYDEPLMGYFLQVSDSRLKWLPGNSEEVNKVTEAIDPSGSGYILELSSSPLFENVSTATIAKFMERYGVPKAHIDNVRQGKALG